MAGLSITGWIGRCAQLVAIVLLVGTLLGASSPVTSAQDKKGAQDKSSQYPPPVKKPKPKPSLAAPPSESKQPAMAQPPLPAERVEADVSARAIAVTAAFKGSEIIVFGAVDNSRQPSPESGYYDVVVAIEGGSLPSTVRRKSNIGGIWINDTEAKYETLPAFYALATTRPLEEITDTELLAKHNIGVGNLRITPEAKTTSALTAADLRDFTSALTRLKDRDGLYDRDDYGVLFTGRSLFRSTIELPANVPVGNLVARVYLFREGTLLSKFTTRVSLERAGVERWIYDAAHQHAWLYGIFTVFVAMSCGFAAAKFFGRNAQ